MLTICSFGLLSFNDRLMEFEQNFVLLFLSMGRARLGFSCTDLLRARPPKYYK